MALVDSARKVANCRVCGQADWQDVLSFGPVPLAGGFLEPADTYDNEPFYPLGVISCRSCRLLSLTHVVAPELLFRVYAYTTSESTTMVRHMRQVVTTCRTRFSVPPDSLVVEIGSNTGTQLLEFRQAGMRVLGIDPALNIADIANQNGVETLPEFFSAATAKMVKERLGSAQLIVGRHVFAHIDELSEVADGVRQLLSPDGVFVIEVPYILDMLTRNEFDTIYHEHLSYFSVGTLVTFFQRHGLQVIDVERFSVHGGSILVFAGLEDGPLQRRQVVNDLIALEEQEGLRDDTRYYDFARCTRQISDQLTELVKGLVADGKSVAGYGAPAKGNTLLNVCGLGLGELRFCCDTTAFKQGKVLPGTHIPVRAPDYAKNHVPDYYLLLAWNYADEILSKERAFLENGGRFIVPNPKPSIVSARP
jgi:novobiocin biosynthesis protein NovU/D-mycarose 3-C-methyltransferase